MLNERQARDAPAAASELDGLLSSERAFGRSSPASLPRRGTASESLSAAKHELEALAADETAKTGNFEGPPAAGRERPGPHAGGRSHRARPCREGAGEKARPEGAADSQGRGQLQLVSLSSFRRMALFLASIGACPAVRPRVEHRAASPQPRLEVLKHARANRWLVDDDPAALADEEMVRCLPRGDVRPHEEVRAIDAEVDPGRGVEDGSEAIGGSFPRRTPFNGRHPESPFGAPDDGRGSPRRSGPRGAVSSSCRGQVAA